MPRHRVRLFVLALLAAVECAAQQPASPSPPPAPKPCALPQHRQFDFWLGEWELRDAAGKLAGHNRITSVHNGCALLGEWQGNGGVTGSSLNLFDKERQRWHQTWVDSGGGLLTLEGGLEDGAMSLRGTSTEAGPPAKRSLQRIRWQPQADGRVRQLWEASQDDGKTWTVAFDGWYTRRK